MSHHRSRLCQFVIDCDDLDRAVGFRAAALDATEEPLPETSSHVYRQLRLPDADIRVLLQRTNDVKLPKERMHLDLRPTTSKPKSNAWKRSAPPGMTTSRNAATTSGCCATPGQRVLRAPTNLPRAARPPSSLA